MLKLFPIIILFCFCGHAALSQEKPIQLTETIIKNTFSESVWTVEDTTMKHDYEMMYLIISEDSVGLFYLNWIESFSGTQCACNFQKSDKFFELKLGGCTEQTEIAYFYGYFTQPNELHILISEEKLQLDKKLLKKTDWIPFERLEIKKGG